MDLGRIRRIVAENAGGSTLNVMNLFLYFFFFFYSLPYLHHLVRLERL